MSVLSKLRRLLRRFTHVSSASSKQENPTIRQSVTDAGYYEEISLRYASAQLVGIMLLALFFVVSLLTDSTLLSSDSLMYFAKDMTASISMREHVARDTLVYSTDEDNRYDLYRDGLAVLGEHKLTVFTATGREAYADSLSYATPRIASSGRYLLAYDLGGMSYRLYNSFACVENVTLTSTIRGVAAANDGSYCIITGGTDYASLVTLYNERFRAIARYHIEEYTVCSDIEDDGRRILIASVSSQNGRMTTHLLLATPGKQTEDAAWTVTDAYPVAAYFTDSGKVMLLSTDCLVLFDTQGKELMRYSFDEGNVRSFRTGGFGCILFCRANSYDTATNILAFDKDGRQVYNITNETQVYDATLYGDTLGLLLQEELRVYRNGESDVADTISLKGDYDALLARDNEEFLLCGDAKAIVVRSNAAKN